jgi:hypothetical protein
VKAVGTESLRISEETLMVIEVHVCVRFIGVRLISLVSEKSEGNWWEGRFRAIGIHSEF